jgi:hypothetical protein
MNEEEARGILAAEVSRLRGLSFETLLDLQQPEHRDVLGASGESYWLEAEAFWDSPRKRTNLRVMVSIGSPRGRRRFSPLVEYFIVAPDGSFVGEETE